MQGRGAYQLGNSDYTGCPSGGSHDLANLYDISIDHPLSATTSITLYLATAQGGTVVFKIYPNGKNAQYAYVELNRRL